MMSNVIPSILNAFIYSSYAPKVIDRITVRHARSKHQKQAVNLSCTNRKIQLLVDVSVICKHDAGTGIQRMVRAVLNELLNNPPNGFNVRPVMATRKKSYQYVDCNLKTILSYEETKITIQTGDMFLGLDFAAHIIPSQHLQLTEWKAQGVSFHFLVYDLLPLLNKKWFSRKLATAFKRWIKEVAVLADSVICISRTVEADLTKWFDDRYHMPLGSVPTKVIPLGWDINSSTPSIGLSDSLDQILAQISKRKTALIVGTIEPRKGHSQILNAFEKLWKNGNELNLVIVGRPGWKTKTLQNRITHHSELNLRLFWLPNASDETLLSLYQSCDGVIIASHAEGYGLPLIEAIGHKKPVFARDIPVFREHEQNGVEYFSDNDVEDLQIKLYKWLKEARDILPQKAMSSAISTWSDTTSELIKGLQEIQTKKLLGNIDIINNSQQY